MLAKVSLNRWVFILLNSLVCFLLYESVAHVGFSLWFHRGAYPAMEDLINGVGIVLIGYGILLEERLSLRKSLGADSQADSSLETGLDQLCRELGSTLLIFGLFAEICVAALRIPHYAVHSHYLMNQALSLGTFFLLASLTMLLVYSVRMALQRAEPAASSATLVVPLAPLDVTAEVEEIKEVEPVALAQPQPDPEPLPLLEPTPRPTRTARRRR